MSWVCRLVIEPVIIRNILRPSNIALEDHPNQISFHEKPPFIVDVQLPCLEYLIFFGPQKWISFTLQNGDYPLVN